MFSWIDRVSEWLLSPPSANDLKCVLAFAFVLITAALWGRVNDRARE